MASTSEELTNWSSKDSSSSSGLDGGSECLVNCVDEHDALCGVPFFTLAFAERRFINCELDLTSLCFGSCGG